MNEGELGAGLAQTPSYRYADQVGGRLFVAGQVPRDAAANVVGPGDPVAQTRQCLDNLFTLISHHGFSRADIHQLTMRTLSDAAIADYVARDQPLDCAGSYKIEALGIALFERIEGADFTAIVGVPLTALVTLLGRFGVNVLG